MTQEALTLALDALYALTAMNHTTQQMKSNAITTIKEALAQPEQEPVAWMYVNTDGECEQIEYGEPFDDPSTTPLYTSPQRTWVGLTDEEKHQCIYDEQGYVLDYEDCVDKTEAKLKEKNT